MASLLITAGVAVGPHPGIAAPLAYVANSYSNSVWVIDTASSTVVAVIPAPGGPTGVAVDAFGGHVYVANRSENDVAVIDAATNQVAATIALAIVPELLYAQPTGADRHDLGTPTAPAVLQALQASILSGPTATHTFSGPTATPTPKRVGVEPFSVALNASGTRLYVTTVGGVSVLDTVAGEVVASVPLKVAADPNSRTQGLAVSQDGRWIYVAIDNGYATDGALAMLDAQTLMPEADITVGLRPLGVAVSPDGARAYVTNTGSNTVSVVDTQRAVVIASLPTELSPTGIAVAPDGTRIYVSGSGGYPDVTGQVTVIDADRLEVTAVVPLGGGAYGIAVGLDGQQVFAVASGSDTLAIIDAQANAVVATVPIGRGAVGLGPFIGPLPDRNATPTPTPPLVAPREFAYVTNRASHSLSVIDTATNREEATVPMPDRPWDIAVSPDGQRIYVALVGDVQQQLLVISAGSHDTMSSIPIDHGIWDLVLAPDGSRLYIPGSQQVSIVDTATNVLATPIPLQYGAGSVAVALDGRELYVTESNNLYFIDTVTLKTLATLSFDFYTPGHLAVAADGARIYLGGAVYDGFAVINRDTRRVEATVPFFFTPGSVGPGAFEVSPDGLSVLVPTYFRVYGYMDSFFQRLTVIDTDRNAIVGSILPEVDPERVAFSRETGLAYVTNSGANTVSVVDTSALRILRSIPVRSSPYGIAVAPAPGAVLPPTITIRPTRTPTPTPTPTATLCRHDVTLQPDIGPPLTRVTLRGYCQDIRNGFYASVAFGTSGLGQVRGDADGNYATVFNVPYNAKPGVYHVSVYVGSEIGSADFTVVPAPSRCAGDCNGDNRVPVNELITMVNIALGTANVSSCTAGDADGSGDITINEIIAAVSNALTACSAS